MSRWQIERAAEREHDRLLADLDAGRISLDEYNREAREIDRDAAAAMEQEVADMQEEYYGDGY